MSIQRAKIPSTVRNSVWNIYIGKEHKQSFCFCCSTEPITFGNFECGHVQSRKKNGDDTVQNLRPICGLCNKSMSTNNMEEFMKNYGFAKNSNWDKNNFNNTKNVDDVNQEKCLVNTPLNIEDKKINECIYSKIIDVRNYFPEKKFENSNCKIKNIVLYKYINPVVIDGTVTEYKISKISEIHDKFKGKGFTDELDIVINFQFSNESKNYEFPLIITYNKGWYRMYWKYSDDYDRDDLFEVFEHENPEQTHLNNLKIYDVINGVRENVLVISNKFLGGGFMSGSYIDFKLKKTCEMTKEDLKNMDHHIDMVFEFKSENIDLRHDFTDYSLEIFKSKNTYLMKWMHNKVNYNDYEVYADYDDCDDFDHFNDCSNDNKISVSSDKPKFKIYHFASDDEDNENSEGDECDERNNNINVNVSCSESKSVDYHL